MTELSVALLTILGTAASVSAVVLYVFNGTRNLIKEMHETQKEVIKTQKEIKELLKKGFGDLSKDISDIKDRINKVG